MYDDELLDEIKYNELVEEVNADFEKKKLWSIFDGATASRPRDFAKCPDCK
jgi:hypothetical protein